MSRAAAEVHEQVRLGPLLDQRGPPALEVDPQRPAAPPARSARSAPSSPCRARAARCSSRSTSPSSSPIASDARSPQAYITSSSARSRSAAGSVPARLGQQALDLAAAEHVGQLAGSPRRAQRGRRIGLEQPVAAQVAVEGAQAGGLAVNRGRRGRRALLAAAGETSRGSPRRRPGRRRAQRRRARRGSGRTGAGRRDRPRACCATARARTRGRRGSRAAGARSGARRAGVRSVAMHQPHSAAAAGIP